MLGMVASERQGKDCELLLGYQVSDRNSSASSTGVRRTIRQRGRRGLDEEDGDDDDDGKRGKVGGQV